MEEKQKILCFHGFGANSNILNHQLRQFKKEFNNIEFVTINGPISVSKNVVMDENFAKMIENQNIYSWGSFINIQKHDIHSAFAPGIEAAIRILKEEGPFYGIMGFSQGSVLAVRLATLMADNQLNLGYELKCFIFVSGAVSWLPYEQQKLCRIPSLHFAGYNDFLVDRSIGLTSQFLNPLVIYHNQGHKIPTLTFQQIKQLRMFLENPAQAWSQQIYIPKL